ncbi:MAG TPA: translation initiation factor IF-2 subunit gamma [Thermoplasmata archaeon]|nr:translation initiation factor IF-2 subunit gamma [Thermoplasmata archaeon]
MTKVETQPQVNIGMVGHVDHGKTTLTFSLTGEKTDRHSEEVKRGISIRLGYADTNFYRCEKCPEPECYSSLPKCDSCGGPAKFLRAVSFVDSPGHETLMATMLSGAAMMDGAVLVIAANEVCPQPQTKEHLLALQILGVKNIVIVQNKIDVVTEEQAKKNHDQIRAATKGTVAEGAPIVPLSAHHKVNIDALIMLIEKVIPTTKRDTEKPPRMYIARSFDVNRPGVRPKDLKGGVIGGSLLQGKLKVGDKIEICPGRTIEEGNKKRIEPILATVEGLLAGVASFKEMGPGGLIAVGTKLDPSVTKADGLSGKVLGHPGTLPPVISELAIEASLLERTVGTAEELAVQEIKTNEMLMLSAGTTTTVGLVTSARKSHVEMRLKLPICAEKGQRVALARRITAKWRLIGYGIVK